MEDISINVIPKIENSTEQVLTKSDHFLFMFTKIIWSSNFKLHKLSYFAKLRLIFFLIQEVK